MLVLKAGEPLLEQIVLQPELFVLAFEPFRNILQSDTTVYLTLLVGLDPSL